MKRLLPLIALALLGAGEPPSFDVVIRGGTIYDGSGGKPWVGDVAIKKKLIEVIDTLVAPIRERRKHFEERPDDVIDALRLGTAKANVIAEETLALAKKAMRQDYFGRTLSIES